MPRPLRERVRDPAWWAEQTAHWWAGDAIGSLAGWIATLPFHGDARWFAGGCAAITAAAVSAIVREVAQNWGDEDGSVGDAIADAVCWTLGGVRASVPFWLLAALR